MALKILITNDDGIYADGIKLLVDFAKEYGEVLVVAPKVEQSGMSHALTLRKPMEIKEVDVEIPNPTMSIENTQRIKVKGFRN